MNSVLTMKTEVIVKSAKADKYVSKEPINELRSYRKIGKYEIGAIFKVKDINESCNRFLAKTEQWDRAKLDSVTNLVKEFVKGTESAFRKADVTLRDGKEASIQHLIDVVKERRRRRENVFVSPVTVTLRVTFQHIVPKSKVTKDMDTSMYREAKTYFYSKNTVIDANIPVIGMSIGDFVSRLQHQIEVLDDEFVNSHNWTKYPDAKTNSELCEMHITELQREQYINEFTEERARQKRAALSRLQEEKSFEEIFYPSSFEPRKLE